MSVFGTDGFQMLKFVALKDSTIYLFFYFLFGDKNRLISPHNDRDGCSHEGFGNLFTIGQISTNGV